jgi:hypothetical protein
MSSVLRWLGFLLACGLASCAGTLDDADRFRDSSSVTPAPSTTPQDLDASIPCPDVATTVLASSSCASSACHAPPSSAGGLDLKSEGLIGRLLGVPAKGGGVLADPALPDESLLYRKLLSDSPPARMPLGGAPLDDATVACVRAWIAALPKAGSDAAVPAPDAGGGTVIRIGSGATASFTDPAGRVWGPDAGFTGGLTVRPTPAATITGTDSEELYRAQRYEAAGFGYSFPVTKGRYTVTLKFAENYLTAAGLRRFNVRINGVAALTNFDIFALAGKNAALDRSFPVEMTNDGPIVIAFEADIAEAKVNAIQIVPAP